MLQVPQVDFASFKYAVTFDGGGESLQWTGPSSAIENMVSRIMAAGQISLLNPPAANATWTLDFWGPSIRCADVPRNIFEEISLNIWNSYNYISVSESYTYLSWIPGILDDELRDSSFINGSGPPLYLPFWYGAAESGPSNYTLESPSRDTLSLEGPLSLYIAVLPGGMEVDIFYSDPGDDLGLPGMRASYGNISAEFICLYRPIKRLSDSLTPCGDLFENETITDRDPRLALKAFTNATMLQCSMINTSYSVEFEFLNGLQNIRSVSNRTSHPDVLNGNTYFRTTPESCASFHTAEDPEIAIPSCEVDVSALRLVSYQSIMAAFNGMVTGSVTQPSVLDPSVNTTVLRTVLKDTHELAFLSNGFYARGDSEPYYFYSSYNDSSRMTVASPAASGTRGSLGAAIEELFENITLSLIMEPYFQ